MAVVVHSIMVNIILTEIRANRKTYLPNTSLCTSCLKYQFKHFGSLLITLQVLTVIDSTTLIKVVQVRLIILIILMLEAWGDLSKGIPTLNKLY